MVKHKSIRATAFLLALAFFCFTASQSVEVAHPIEESGRRHEHSQGSPDSSADLFCEEVQEHQHQCLHQQSLVPSIEPPRLTPDWTRQVSITLSRVPAAFVLVLDLRSRAPPAFQTP